MLANEITLATAAAHLTGHDPVLSPIIAQAGPCPLRPHKNYYQELVQSIIGQQLSLRAAAAIEARFIALYEGTFPPPAALLSTDFDTLRAVGLSRGKIAYIRDLAEHILAKKIVPEKLDHLSNEEIINELTAVKGIGEWTVHMFLIFCMGRLDVLPHGDLGIKNGVRNLYGFDTQPTAEDVKLIAAENRWHPYETVASWYVWRSLELPANT